MLSGPGLLRAVFLASLLLLQAYPAVDTASARTVSGGIFATAAARSGVPLPILLGVAWEQSGLSNRHGRPSIDGGYGLMGLARRSDHNTLHAAAGLLHVSDRKLRASDRLNVLGGALLLARYARTLSSDRLPKQLSDWTNATIRFAGLRSTVAARMYVHDLYAAIRSGIRSGGYQLQPIASARPATQLLPHLGLFSSRTAQAVGADYAPALWEPASPANYTPDRRPAKHKIRYIVIHDTEGSCGAAVNWFQNSAAQGSAQYIVCRNGTIIQTVREKDVAWHCGNWPINQHSIGIEHEGFADHPIYTRAQYLASAALVRYLTRKYNIPLNRDTIFGHENVPDGGHVDPGPYWDWSLYMSQVRQDQAGYDSGMSSIASLTGEGYIHSCPSQSCQVLGSANWGEEFAVFGAKSGWDQISYGGQSGWIPRAVTAAGSGRLVTVTAPTHIFVGPGSGTGSVGTAARGQRYVAMVKDRNFWYIFFNHRYGFIPAAATKTTSCTLSSSDIPTACGGNPVPWVLVSPAFAPAHSILTIQGANYPAKTQVVLKFGGTTLGKVTSDSLGTFSVGLPVPVSMKPGPVAVVGSTASGTIAQTPFLLDNGYHPRVSVSAKTLQPGTSVVVKGAGYPVLQAVTIKVTVSSSTGQAQTVQATGSTDGAGRFSLKVKVPTSANSGKAVVIASVPGGTARTTVAVSGTVAVPTPKPKP